MSQFADPKRQRTITYILLGVIAIGLVITGVLIFNHSKATRDANAKADQLIAKLQDAGLPAPSREQIARQFGSDGGSVCEDPNAALRRAALYAELTTGAGGTGQRPIIADSRVVAGERLIISIYCPDQLAAFNQHVADLKFDDVIKE